MATGADVFRQDVKAIEATAIAVLQVRRPEPPETKRTDIDARTRIETPASINDARARVIKVRAVARSRTAPLFRAGERTEPADEPLPPLSLLNGDALPGPVDGVSSAWETLIIRSRVQPARPSPLTIRPAFAIEPTAKAHAGAVTRSVRLRIRLRRPWFASGAGERLGIVLWPPAIQGRIGLAGDTASRGYDSSAELRDLWSPWQRAAMDFSQWSDRDLGPGGAFVTRWGADPIRAGRRAEGWLLQPSQFPDLPPEALAAADGWLDAPDPWDDRPRYVPAVAMPLPRDENGPAPEPTLTVGLLTYAPRFDLDSETWYVDVPFDPLDAVDPFLRLGLVRFQPYAATAALAVSEPVVEWVQVPPRRTLSARRETKDPLTVAVVVEGAAAPRSTRDPENPDPSMIADWLHGPLMRMRLVRRWADGREAPCRLKAGGFAEREHVPSTQDDLDQALDARKDPSLRLGLAVRPTAAGVGLRWEARFALAEDAARLPEGVKLMAVVEEVHAMRPATYFDEPHRRAPPEADGEVLEVTGPRFAASVEVA